MQRGAGCRAQKFDPLSAKWSNGPQQNCDAISDGDESDIFIMDPSNDPSGEAARKINLDLEPV